MPKYFAQIGVTFLFALLAPLTSSAGTISLGPAPTIGSVDGVVDFEGSSLLPGDLITTEFSAGGITFAGNSGSTGAKFSSCGAGHNAGPWGIDGNYATNLDFFCSTISPGIDDFSMLFAAPVDEVSMGWVSFNHFASTTITALMNGVVQATLNLSPPTGTLAGFMNFSGMIFDEIHIADSDGADYFQLDNISFSLAAVEESPLPLPGALALLGFGLLGLGLRRRH